MRVSALVARIWPYARRSPGFMLGTLGCAIGTTLAGMVFPKVTGRVIDEVILVQRPERLLSFILVVAGAFFIRDFLNGLRIILNNTFEQRVILQLRQDLYETLQALPLRWFDSRSSGDLMSRVGEDVQSVERVLIDGVEQGVVALLQLLGVGFYLFSLNVRLACWALLPIPILAGGAYWYTVTAHQRYRKQRKASGEMQSLLLDHLQGVRQIKAFDRGSDSAREFRGKSEKVRDATLEIMRAWALYNPSMTFVAALGAVLVLWIGGQDVLANTGFTQGELVTFLLYVGMFYEPVGRLHQMNQLLQAGRAAGERVFEIMDSPRETDVATSPSEWPARVRGLVEFERISFEYRDSLPVLHDLSFRIEPGTTVAVVGPSGAGKSTLVNLIPRFYESSSGEIRIDGIPITQVRRTDLRSQMGLVSQESFMFNTSIIGNLRLGRPDATREEIETVVQLARAEDFVKALPEGLETIVGERGVKLSGGEKQRLAIARALLKNPPLLILDEATASVDTETERLIQEALEVLLKGRTAFVIAHRLSTVRHADLILVLDQGKIVEQGNHEDLMLHGGIYSKLCQVQERGWLREKVT